MDTNPNELNTLNFLTSSILLLLQNEILTGFNAFFLQLNYLNNFVRLLNCFEACKLFLLNFVRVFELLDIGISSHDNSSPMLFSATH